MCLEIPWLAARKPYKGERFEQKVNAAVRQSSLYMGIVRNPERFAFAQRSLEYGVLQSQEDGLCETTL